MSGSTDSSASSADTATATPSLSFPASSSSASSSSSSSSSSSLSSTSTSSGPFTFGGGLPTFAFPTSTSSFASLAAAPSSALFGATTDTSASTATSASTSTSSDQGEETVPDADSTAEYTPLVKLQEVVTTTGEEADQVLYTQRAALYRFDTNVNEWKERGRGEVKLLQNKDTKKVRILLRQDKTLKCCMNHIVRPEFKLTPNAGSDRSWTWRCTDYAGDAPELQTFAIRFKDADSQFAHCILPSLQQRNEFAGVFKSHFEEAQKTNGALYEKEAKS